MIYAPSADDRLDRAFMALADPVRPVHSSTLAS